VPAPELLSYRNVSVFRGDQLALDRVSLTISRGEHVGILGPNGCGKSTLIKTMTRECYPAEGRGDWSLRILGHERWDVTQLRRMLGIVTNDLVAECTRGMSSDFAELSRKVNGRDTVLSGYFSSVGLWSHHHVTGAMERQAERCLAQMDASHLSSRPVHQMSSGEVRRVVIARALVHDPVALVLDEPSNSLDVAATHELRESVRRVASAGTSVVLVTHHLPDIIPEIGRVILLKAGKVVADGPKTELLAADTFSALFGVPVSISERNGYYQMW
jgi:iron complex transport system ATP-binding protein